MLNRVLSAIVALGTAVSAAGPIQAPTDHHRPVVDLGYTLQQGTPDKSGDIYAFRNIRFADPPLGKYRFKPPAPVSTVNRTINDGSIGYACPQAIPEWIIEKEASQRGITPFEVRRQHESDQKIPQNEDCLFLDVLVPKKLFMSKAGRLLQGTESGRAHEDCQEKGAPVMVWIYGGGYVIGEKAESLYTPTGLIERSLDDGGEGIVYVAMNYRLGMFGWLNAGGDENIIPNVGLQDQRLALEWVKKYIYIFGGDPERVTVFGESAGGGSIMHHITGEGGKKAAPFERAIIQSPGFQPALDVPGIWQRTLATASKVTGRQITNGAELIALDQKTLLQINNEIVTISPNSTYTYGPTVDGGYVPDLPSVLLLEGRFDLRPKLMLGHNSHEGLLYVPPDVNTNATVRALFVNAMNTIPKRNLEYILNTLYPPAPSLGMYKSERERGTLIFSELGFSCNTRFLATAFRNDTWNYRFQVPPGIHGQDIPYTFYHNETNHTDAKLARKMQLYFTNFAQSGTPNGRGSRPEWPVYGYDAHLATFGSEGVGTDVDETKNERCAYWQSGMYRY